MRGCAPRLETWLEADPKILAFCDEHDRSRLHVCGMAKPKGSIEGSLRTADVLARVIDEAAFTEGEWRATPVWHCTANSKSALARHLLERGASPDHALFSLAGYCASLEGD